MRIINPTVYSRKELKDINAHLVPKRIAIIMDGNRRWAKERGLTTEQGHRAGAKALIDLILPASDIGIEVLTVYGFSTENWLRDDNEVSALLSIIQESLLQEELNAIENRVKLDFLGDTDSFPPALKSLCNEAREITKSHESIKVVLALNYGARHEILAAFKTILERVKSKKIDKELISPSLIESYTQTDVMGGGIDMVIRTSGEKRVSNFLLWQLPGAEYIDIPTYWPSFDKYSLLETIRIYQKRKISN